MFQNYFKTAIRNLIRNKVFSTINIVGLALGMTCSLLIFLWVQDERSYDNFHANSDQLYKVIIHDKNKDGSISGSMDATPGILADALKKEIPEITYAATVGWENDQLFAVGNKVSREKGRAVGEDFFQMFSFPLSQGDTKTALSTKDKIVLSQNLAEKYFGKENPIGKIVRIDDKRDFIVSAIAKNVPENSSIRFDFVIQVKTLFEDNPWMIAGWDHFGPATYVMLHKNVSAEKVNAKISSFLSMHDKKDDDKSMSFQLYKDNYLYSRFTKGVADGGRIEYVRLFSIIAIFILLIACINFMNLATARSVKRAKEVGIRKVVGAAKSMLIKQFMGEAMLTTFIAVIVAIILAMICMPLFNTFTQKKLAVPISDPSFIITVIGFTIVTGFIAGSHPALFMSSLSPIKVLKGALRFKPGAASFRKGLVIFQFTLSIILIICTIIVYRQMNYVQTKNLGLDRENVIYLPLEGSLAKNSITYKNEIIQSGNIENVAFCSNPPTNAGMWSQNISWEGKAPNDKTGFVEMDANYDFIKTMKIQLNEGRDFSPAFGEDSSNYLVNETAVKIMKMKNPIGQTFSHQGKKGKIIGVMKDFHMFSLHDPIAPVFIEFQSQFDAGIAIVRTKAGKTKATLSTLEAVSKKINPTYPFDFIFADDLFNQQYKSEMLVGTLANIFASLAIFISCLGLFGLAMFMAEQRTKEISIRKVVGASIASIVTLLSKEFVQLVMVAFIIAAPISWWAMHKWLNDFAYRVDINWWIFILAGFIALLIALITISFNAIKAAVANPVKSLRTE